MSKLDPKSPTKIKVLRACRTSAGDTKKDKVVEVPADEAKFLIATGKAELAADSEKKKSKDKE